MQITYSKSIQASVRKKGKLESLPPPMPHNEEKHAGDILGDTWCTGELIGSCVLFFLMLLPFVYHDTSTKRG